MKDFAMRSLNEKPSEISIYVWNIVGSMANALLSVIILMIVTRRLDEGQADIFSVAWSISQLMATIGTYQIRTYQATDVKETFSFKQYFMFRTITVILMSVSSFCYIMIKNYGMYKAAVVMILCLFRAVDSLADVYEGWFQQKERLDLAGKAMTYRIVIAVIAFGITLAFFQNLIISCLALLGVYSFCLFCFNVRYTLTVDILKPGITKIEGVKWIWKMLKEGTPLFINAFLMMSITNTPKMGIDDLLEIGGMEQGSQTVFNVLFMPASVLTLIYIVFRPLLTELAIQWAKGKIRHFLMILGKMCLCLLGIGLLTLIVSAIIGLPVLSYLYAIDLRSYRLELLIIMTGGSLCTFSYVLDNALVVIRKQYLLLISYILSWIYIKMIAGKIIDEWGLTGAALSYASAMLVFLIITTIIFIVCLKNEKK